MTQMNDNFDALAAGDAGAPEIQTEAIAADAIDHTLLESPAAGTTYTIHRIQGSTESTTDSGSYPADNIRYDLSGRRYAISVLVPGTITVELEHRRQVAGTSYVKVVKNGTDVQEWSTTSESFQSRSVNVSVAVGDLVVILNRVTSSVGIEESDWRNINIKSANPSMAVAA